MTCHVEVSFGCLMFLQLIGNLTTECSEGLWEFIICRKGFFFGIEIFRFEHRHIGSKSFRTLVEY